MKYVKIFTAFNTLIHETNEHSQISARNSHKIPFVSITKINLLILFRTIIAVYFENCVTLINAP
jgi:hypothetical protein